MRRCPDGKKTSRRSVRLRTYPRICWRIYALSRKKRRARSTWYQRGRGVKRLLIFIGLFSAVVALPKSVIASPERAKQSLDACSIHRTQSCSEQEDPTLSRLLPK